MNNKISKDIVPNDFSFSLAIVDFFPCLFFLLTSIVLGLSLSSIVFITGSIITFISGLVKVIWKLIVVFKRRIFGLYLFKCVSSCLLALL